MTSRLFQRLKPCTSFPKRTVSSKSATESNPAPTSDALGPLHHDEHQSFRVRKDGKKLPLPPILDPVVLEERSKWEKPKAQPSVEKFTPFQKKLWENPYAHVLASPVRECRATFLLLPTALLITLHPRPHPETSDPWLLPVSLTTTDHHLGTPYRFLGRRLVAQTLGRKSSWKGGLYSRLVEKLGTTKMGKIVWREDMPELILDLLRKNLLNKLIWYFQKSGHLVPCKSPRSEDIEEIADVSGVLLFRSLATRADEVQEKALFNLKEVEFQAKYWAGRHLEEMDPHTVQNATHTPPIWWRGPLLPELSPRIKFPPLEFKTTEWKGRKIAVYSLTDLLGEEKMKELVEGSRFEAERCVVLKRGRHNVPVEMMLLQLQAYLTTSGP